MDLSIGGGGKSSHSKGLQDFANADTCHYEQIKGLICEADFCTVLVPDSDEIERFAHSAGSETLGAWKKSKAVIQPLDYKNIDKRAKQKFSVIAKKLDCFVAKLFAPRNDMGKKAAFTLAEVLITLGIIGVVAAMTLPKLIANYEKKVTATKAKKAYSELLNAIKMSEAHNGEMKEWTYPESASIEITRSFVEEYIKPYFNGLKECSVGNDDSCGVPVSYTGVNYILPNGTGLSMVIHPVGKFYVIVDTNGKGQPNTLGHDLFNFSANNTNKNLLPYGWKENLTKEDIVNGYTDDLGNFISCKKTKGDNENELHRHGCTALLMLNNWEIDKDYPW